MFERFWIGLQNSAPVRLEIQSFAVIGVSDRDKRLCPLARGFSPQNSHAVFSDNSVYIIFSGGHDCTRSQS